MFFVVSMPSRFAVGVGSFSIALGTEGVRMFPEWMTSPAFLALQGPGVVVGLLLPLLGVPGVPLETELAPGANSFPGGGAAAPLGGLPGDEVQVVLGRGIVPSVVSIHLRLLCGCYFFWGFCG